jgi:hypothetical protein
MGHSKIQKKHGETNLTSELRNVLVSAQYAGWRSYSTITGPVHAPQHRGALRNLSEAL